MFAIVQIPAQYIFTLMVIGLKECMENWKREPGRREVSQLPLLPQPFFTTGCSWQIDQRLRQIKLSNPVLGSWEQVWVQWQGDNSGTVRQTAGFPLLPLLPCRPPPPWLCSTSLHHGRPRASPNPLTSLPSWWDAQRILQKKGCLLFLIHEWARLCWTFRPNTVSQNI